MGITITFREKLWLMSWIIGSLLLLIFSFTQVDLNFSLQSVPVVGTLLVFIRNVGYFNRPLTTVFYLVTIVFLFVVYCWTLYEVRRSNLSKQAIILGIIGVSLILVPSYPAFSRDIFNNIFVGKLILVYHLNPHTTIPMYLSGIDPWLSFLHWTHAPSVYGYGMTLLSTLFYVLSFGKFIIALFMVKLLYAMQYIFLAYIIWKLIVLLRISRKYFSLVFIVFHPLLIIETLVNAHNDATMMLVALTGIYLYLNERRRHGVMLILSSISTKYVSVGLLPFLLFKSKPIFMSICMSIVLAIFLLFFGRELQPWYAMWILPVMALYEKPNILKIVYSGIFWSFMFTYAPFFYFGHWNSPVPIYKLVGIVGGSILGIPTLAVAVGYFNFIKNNKK